MAEIIATADVPTKYKFVFTNEMDNTITSFTAYEKESEAVAAAAAFADIAKAAEHYSTEVSGVKQHILIKDNDGNIQAVSNDFDDEEAAKNARDAFVVAFNKECDSEGMHLVEHLLLRPRNNAFALPPVCLDPGCDFCGEQDPFSFRMSVVLPYWPKHFLNMAFRDYFEDMMHREAPAHTLVKICWLSNEDMRSFESHIKTGFRPGKLCSWYCHD